MQKLKQMSTQHNKRFKFSLLASAVIGLTSGATFAQEAEVTEEEDAEVEVIDVRGTRTDLFNAQNTKRFSETVWKRYQPPISADFPTVRY